MTLDEEAYMTNQKMIESPLAWGPQNELKLSTSSKLPHGGRLLVDQDLVIVIPHGIHQGAL